MKSRSQRLFKEISSEKVCLLAGGNLDDRRIGKGAKLYYPVAVAGGLLSMGDAHLAQGDGELDGTAIETSITGEVQIARAHQTLPSKRIGHANKARILNDTRLFMLQFKITLIKKPTNETDAFLQGLDYVLLENVNEWVAHGFSYQVMESVRER